ncbi:hypothetical protein L9F63_013052, partial [Diploptera punctata]
MKYVIFYSILTLCFLHTGTSIRCYICEPHMNPNCFDPDNNELNSTECSLDSFNEYEKNYFGIHDNVEKDIALACIRTVVSDDSGNVTIGRGCAPARSNLKDPCNPIRDIIELLNLMNVNQLQLHSCD